MKIPIPFFRRAIVVGMVADPRGPFRPRFSIRGLMIAIALLAVVVGIPVRRWAEERRQALATQQLIQKLDEALTARIDAMQAAGTFQVAPPAAPR